MNFDDSPTESERKLTAIKHLVCDLIMYREDIDTAPCRFQDVIDRLIAEVVDENGIINI